MYFPWVGLLEQIRLADIFVHYNDVQYARGFFNRVQVKTPRGLQWMTIPLKNQHRGQRIDEVIIDDRVDWREEHRNMLRQHYHMAPFKNEMLSLVDTVFCQDFTMLAEVSKASTLALANYFGLVENRNFILSKSLKINGKGSQRLLDISLALGAQVYITGHGAKNYLDHTIFEDAGIEVRYMHYRQLPYPQLHGEFTPYVTSLDLIANCGKDGHRFIQSEAIHWKNFIHESN
jgi:hypothetical protein